jgi:hypothetical protein
MSVKITDELVAAASQAALDRNYGTSPDDTTQQLMADDMRVGLEAAAPAIQEAVAYRIASKLNTLSTERAQADDMTASRNFKQAADVAVRVAKGGW